MEITYAYSLQGRGGGGVLGTKSMTYIGVVPKKDGGWRLIYHLSALSGSSVNDYINLEYYSLKILYN